MSTATLTQAPAPVKIAIHQNQDITWTRSHLHQAIATSACSAGADYRIRGEDVSPLTFVETDGKTVRLAMTKIFDLESSSKNSRNQVVLARVHLPGANPATDPVWRVWCGDPLVEGIITESESRTRGQKALKGLPLSVQSKIISSIRTVRASKPSSTAPRIHFMNGITNDYNSMGCKHVRHVMHELVKNGKLDDVLANLEERYQSEILGRVVPSTQPTPASGSPTIPAAAQTVPAILTPSSQAPAPNPATGINAHSLPTAAREKEILEENLRQQGPMFREILDVAGPKVLWKRPVLILGEAGYGKTFAARKIGKSGLYDKYYEFPVNPETDGLDFIGGPRPVSIPRADGTYERQYIHMDSQVITAFRDASEGKTVLLLVDEVGNARREVLNALKNLLNPDDDHYVVDTARPAALSGGLAKGEQLRVPVKNITIIGTTNIGAGYEANTGDRAVMNRFYRIYHSVDHEVVKDIFAKEMLAQGMKRDVMIRMGRFYEGMIKLKNDQQIERLPNPRDLISAIRLAPDDHQLPRILARMTYQWAGEELDGTPNQDQMDLIRSAIKECFNIKDDNWNWKP
jgi:hypothetical protein